MKLFLFGLLITLGAINLSAQDNSIRMEDSAWGGLHFYQNGVHLYKSDIKSILRSNPQALEFYQSGRSNKNLGNFLGLVGGFAVGYCGVGLLSKDPSRDNSKNLIGLLIGLGATVFGFSMDSQGTQKMKQAIQLYNRGLDESSNKKHLGFTIGNNGLGLKMTF